MYIRTCVCSCGLCCSKQYQCKKCIESTLLANGIDLKDIDIFEGVSKEDMSYNISKYIKNKRSDNSDYAQCLRTDASCTQ